MLYETIFRELQKERIKYLVVGGVAVNLYGILRATADLDLFLWLGEKENITRFISVMKRLGYKPRAPVPADDLADSEKRASWVNEKNALVFTFIHPGSFEQIDIFLKEPISFPEAYDKRRTLKVSDFEIPVVSIGDLKRLKSAAGREKDLSDLAHLKKLENLGPNP